MVSIIASSIARSFPVTIADTSCKELHEVPMMHAPFSTEQQDGCSPFILHQAVPLPGSRAIPPNAIGGFSVEGNVAWFAAENEVVLWEFDSADGQQPTTMTTSHLDSRVLTVCVARYDEPLSRASHIVMVATIKGLECFTCNIHDKEIVATAEHPPPLVAVALHRVSKSESVIAVLKDGAAVHVAVKQDGVDGIDVRVDSDGMAPLSRGITWLTSFIGAAHLVLSTALDEARHAIYVLHSSRDEHAVSIWSIESELPRKKHTVTITSGSTSSRAKPLQIHASDPLDGFCFVVIFSDTSRSYYATEAPTWLLGHPASLRPQVTMPPMNPSVAMTSCHSAYTDAAVVVFDNTSHALIAAGRTVPYADQSVKRLHDVVSTVHVADRILAVGSLCGAAGVPARIGLLSRSGLSCVVERLSDAALVARHCSFGFHAVSCAVVDALEPVKAASLLIDAAVLSEPVPPAIAAALDDLAIPSLRGNTVTLSPTVHAVKCLVDRSLGTLWNMRLSAMMRQHLRHLEEGAAVLSDTLDGIIDTTLVSRGWAACCRPVVIAAADEASLTLVQCRSPKDAIDAQAQYLQVLIDGLHRTLTLAQLLAVVFEDSNTNSPRAPLPAMTFADVVWGGHGDKAVTDMCLPFFSAFGEAHQRLVPFADRLPLIIQALLRVRELCNSHPQRALEEVVRHVHAFVEHDCVGSAIKLLQQYGASDFVQLEIAAASMDADGMRKGNNIQQLLSDIPAERLGEGLSVVFRRLPLRQDIHFAVLQWLTDIDLDDGRLEDHAHGLINVSSPHMSSFLTTLDTSHNPAHNYFLACVEEKRGERPQAARRLMDLALAPSLPLGTRQRLATKAANVLSPQRSEDLDHAMRSMELQAAVAAIVADAAHIVSDPHQASSVKQDCERLSEYLFTAADLFQFARQYEQFGGAEVQLQILKVAPDADEGAIAHAVHAFLEYPREMSWTVMDACHELLCAHYADFGARFPLPFLLSYLHQCNPDEESTWVPHYLVKAERIHADAVFEAYHRLLEEPGLSPSAPNFMARPTTMIVCIAALVTLAADASPSEAAFISRDRLRWIHGFTDMRIKRLLAAHETGTSLLEPEEVELLRELKDRFLSDELMPRMSMMMTQGTTTFF